MLKREMPKTKARRRAEFFYKIRYTIKTLPYHFLVMGSVFIIALLFGKWFEAPCFLIAFFSLRYKFETTFHCDSIVWCMVFTNSIFAVSIIVCPPIYMYIFASIIFAFIDCLILWLIQTRKEYRQDKESAEKTLVTMTAEIMALKNPKEELLARCRKAKLSDRDTKIAVMYYYERKTPKDIWLWHCQQKEYDSIEWNSMYQILWRIGKKIN